LCLRFQTSRSTSLTALGTRLVDEACFATTLDEVLEHRKLQHCDSVWIDLESTLKVMMRNKPASSMQKTYDECYLICSTAVYFEGQVDDLLTTVGDSLG
jgi:hypothetical protein